MKKKLALLVTAMMMLSAAGCSNSGTDTSGTDTTQEETSETAELDAQSDGAENNETETKEGEEEKQQFSIDMTNDGKYPQLEDPQPGDKIASINTSMGTVKVRFFPQYAPKAVENFMTHADEGYYNGVTFHRVIKDFMIQGGDPEGTGRGGESIWGKEFENEVTPSLRSFRGALCMANAGPDTNGSQFYIVQSKTAPGIEDMEAFAKDDTVVGYDVNGKEVKSSDFFPQEVIDKYKELGGYPSLDYGYTIFGQVYEGMDVVDAIAAVETDSSDKPLTDVTIESIYTGTYEG
ncbi:MAG: peptidylprolyl isomerase [Firmicutes bacterium]|nr:peptidylprolyl isomerase [Bacillota bacterium]